MTEHRSEGRSPEKAPAMGPSTGTLPPPESRFCLQECVAGLRCSSLMWNHRTSLATPCQRTKQPRAKPRWIDRGALSVAPTGRCRPGRSLILTPQRNVNITTRRTPLHLARPPCATSHSRNTLPFYDTQQFPNLGTISALSESGRPSTCINTATQPHFFPITHNVIATTQKHHTCGTPFAYTQPNITNQGLTYCTQFQWRALHGVMTTTTNKHSGRRHNTTNRARCKSYPNRD